jgi:hypothetical protein
MMKAIRFATIFALFLSVGMAQEKNQEKPKAAEAPICPMHTQQPTGEQQHHEGVVQRGDEVMGFSHDKTTHHFRLYEDGGAIEVTANRADDTESREAIRSHLGHIVTMFAAGNFSAPMLIHAQNPPGTEGMKRLKEAIQYKFETMERGARIRITTKDPDALRSVHEFLRFQIADHQTGDATDVAKAP